ESSAIIDIRICILHSDYGSLRIDNHEKDCELDLFGYILTKEKLNKKFEVLDKFDNIQNIIEVLFMNVDVKSDIEDLSQDPNRDIVTDVKKVSSEIIITDATIGHLRVKSTTLIHDEIADKDNEDNKSEINELNKIIHIGSQAPSRRTKLIKNSKNSKKMFDNPREVAVPCANFLPLFTDVTKLSNDIVEIYQEAEHNKKISKNIEKNVKELVNEFDSTIHLLQFSLMVDFNIRADKDHKDIIKSDIEDLNQYLSTIGSGVTDINKNVSCKLVHLMI
ncbi:18229_t:CDS:2, partial [Funneliformis geosporum]